MAIRDDVTSETTPPTDERSPSGNRHSTSGLTKKQWAILLLLIAALSVVAQFYCFLGEGRVASGMIMLPAAGDAVSQAESEPLTVQIDFRLLYSGVPLSWKATRWAEYYPFDSASGSRNYTPIAETDQEASLIGDPFPPPGQRTEVLLRWAPLKFAVNVLVCTGVFWIFLAAAVSLARIITRWLARRGGLDEHGVGFRIFRLGIVFGGVSIAAFLLWFSTMIAVLLHVGHSAQQWEAENGNIVLNYFALKDQVRLTIKGDYTGAKPVDWELIGDDFVERPPLECLLDIAWVHLDDRDSPAALARYYRHASAWQQQQIVDELRIRCEKSEVVHAKLRELLAEIEEAWLADLLRD